MSTEPPLLLALDLTGTFAFGLNGALTAVRTARLDVVGVVSLGMITALGGGVIRDVLIGAIPPATFVDWRYFALAAGGALIAFAFGGRLDRLDTPITVMDAVGLSTFAVIGASKALTSGLHVAPAVLLGVVTAVGGGTIRDALVLQVPTVLRSDLYAIPALVAAGITVLTVETGTYGLPSALGAVAACFIIRMLGVRYNLQAPRPLGKRPEPGPPDDASPDPSSGGPDSGGSGSGGRR